MSGSPGPAIVAVRCTLRQRGRALWTFGDCGPLSLLLIIKDWTAWFSPEVVHHLWLNVAKPLLLSFNVSSIYSLYKRVKRGLRCDDFVFLIECCKILSHCRYFLPHFDKSRRQAGSIEWTVFQTCIFGSRCPGFNLLRSISKPSSCN